MEDTRTRREEYSEATKRALLDAATSLFATRGFRETSLDEVAERCRVTKGAVYHHFQSKQALFEAVLDELSLATCDAILRAAAAHESAWDAAMAGMDTFLDACLDPTYLRLCFQEGPAALGFDNWWEKGESHEIALIRGMLDGLKAQGLVEVEDVGTLTQLFFGCMTAAALSMARAPDPRAVRDGVREVATRLVWGLRPRS